MTCYVPASVLRAFAASLRAIAASLDAWAHGHHHRHHPVPAMITASSSDLIIHRFQPEEPAMRISVTIPEDCYDASLPIRGIADSQGKPFLDVPGAFECLFEGEVAEASFDPVARMIHFKATDDGRAGGQGKITLKTGTAQLTVDVFLDPPTASDIIADPADLIIRMTAPPIVQDPPIADPIVQDPPPIAEPDPVA